MSNFYTLTISKIKRETKDAVAISFEIPKDLKSEFQFIAGQYITLKTTIDNKEVRRAYSLCSSPNSNKITVAVKAIKGGHFSIFANTQLKERQQIEVSKPEGKFVLDTNTNNSNNYLAFAAGSGITPILSMLKSVLENEPNSKFVLVFGNKSTFETIFFDELNALATQYKEQLFIQYVFSKEQPKDALFGRIDVANTNFVLNKFKSYNFNAVYLCGPEVMIHTVSDVLKSKNFKDEIINFELFTASKEVLKTENILEGNAEITVLLDDETTTFTMSSKLNILDASLKEGLDAPYSCQGGICSSCLAKVTEGNAVMDKNTILSEGEIAEGLILTCQAHPTTAKLTIDFDDV